jgi:hypothetical protein
MELHSFHLNIGVGDGSIYILVDTLVTKKTGSRSTVKCSILIDGGKAKDAVQCIQVTMT